VGKILSREISIASTYCCLGGYITPVVRGADLNFIWRGNEIRKVPSQYTIVEDGAHPQST